MWLVKNDDPVIFEGFLARSYFAELIFRQIK
jgi:hypothetical protein